MPFTSFNHEEDDNIHIASQDYPELTEILEQRPPPENQFKTAAKDVHDARCSLCNMNPATRDVGGMTVCDSCAENQLGIPIGQEPSEFGQPKFAKGFPETQKCKYCKNPVTKRLIWAEGMAYIPVCDSHVDQARDDIVNKNNDEVIATKEAGFITDWLTGKSGNPKSQPGAENAWSYDWCKYRKNSHCMLPKDLDQKRTKETGNPLWIPYDRGLCPRMKWAEQQLCPVSEPGPNAKYSSLDENLDEIDISTEASIDKVASYWDVQQKAKRLRRSGDVKLMQTPQEGLPYIYAYVTGDHGDYNVVIEKDGYKIKGWLCNCAWGNFGPDGPDAEMRSTDSPYKNRKCSHVLAAAYELQSQNMKNAKLAPFVVKSPNGEKHTIVHVDDGILITDMGEILDSAIHPNFDPKSGLQ